MSTLEEQSELKSGKKEAPEILASTGIESAIPKEAKSEIDVFVNLLDSKSYTDDIIGEGLKSTYNNTVLSLPRDNPISMAVNDIKDDQKVSHKEIVGLLEEFGFDFSDKYPDYKATETVPLNNESNSTPQNKVGSSELSSKGPDLSEGVSSVSSGSIHELGSGPIPEPESAPIPEPESAPSSDNSKENIKEDIKKVIDEHAKEGGVNIKLESSTTDVLGIGRILEGATSVGGKIAKFGGDLIRGTQGGGEKGDVNNVNDGVSTAFKATKDDFADKVNSSDSPNPIMSVFIEDTHEKMSNIREEIKEGIEQLTGMTKGSNEYTELETSISNNLDNYASRGDALEEMAPSFNQDEKAKAFKELKDGEELMSDIKDHDSLDEGGKLKTHAERLAEVIEKVVNEITKIFSKEKEMASPEP